MTDTIVLIHGFPLDGTMWDFQAGALSGSLQVLAPSLPGLGAQPAAARAAASRVVAARPDSTGDLGGISVPTMVIASTGDTLIPASVTAPLADRIPDATLETIDGVGHLSNMEAPGEFTLL